MLSNGFGGLPEPKEVVGDLNFIRNEQFLTKFHLLTEKTTRKCPKKLRMRAKIALLKVF